MFWKIFHNLIPELLKQRFGDSKFRGADVMVADIAMSKRIDANIRRTINRAYVSIGSAFITAVLSLRGWISSTRCRV